MHELEPIVTIGCTIAALIWWVNWMYMCIWNTPLRRKVVQRLVLLAWPVVCAAGLWVILKQRADAEVRDSFFYTYMYVVMGLGWVAISTALSTFCGYSTRDDVIERGNPAAVPVTLGLLAGLMCCYAGGNIGDGPGFWVVFLAAAMATIALFGSWYIFELTTSSFEAVTVERDADCGIRVGGLLVSLGVIYGCGAAGDWTGFFPMIVDFLPYAAAGAGAVALSISMERAIRAPNHAAHRMPMAMLGLAPAGVQFVAAIFLLNWLGWWK